MPNVTRKPIEVTIIEYMGAWQVITPLYRMTGVTIGDMLTVVAPLAGLRANFTVEAPSTSIANDFLATARQLSGWSQYLDPNSPSLTNYLTNLDLMAWDKDISSIRPLKDALTGKPMILVGAGPSLKEHLPEIKRITELGTAYVVAGGSAIRALCEANINPHLCVAFDSNQNEWDQVFSQLGVAWMRKQTLLTYPYLERSCFDWWEGSMYVAGGSSAFTGNNTYDSLPTIDVGGSSVSTMICNLASYTGANSLHLVGVDLSLSNGQSYSIDASIDSSGIIEHNGYKTTHHWMQEASNINSIAKRSSYETRRSGDGLPIPGYEQVGLDVYTKPHNLHMSLDLCTPDQRMVWMDSIYSICEEVQQGLSTGVLSPEFKTTRAYKQIIAPYETFLRAREIWTRHYDQHIIEAVCQNITQTIHHEKQT